MAALLSVAAIAVICAFVVGLVAVLRSSDAYQGAIARVKAAPAVAAALGTPVKEGFFFQGQIQTNGSSGRAEMAIPLRGPKGAATARVFANKADGTWRYVQLVVHVDGTQETIDLSDREMSREQPGSTTTAGSPSPREPRRP